jgi:hypothetical protein
MEKMDMLRELFNMQAALNNATFAKYDIRDGDGNVLTMEALKFYAHREDLLGPNSLTNTWLGKYLQALNAESEELQKSLLWKWWSKDGVDIQNARVEIIDQLHFWISLALTAGLDADDVMNLYKKKNAVNLERLRTGYSQATKTEADNQGVKL